jgi:hypothetical protein
MEQYVRDCRITQTYEGTNGVQALDLVGRKLPADNGRLLRRFFQPIAGFIKERAGDLGLAAFAEPLAKAFDPLAAGHGPDRPRRQGGPGRGRRGHPTTCGSSV